MPAAAGLSSRFTFSPRMATVGGTTLFSPWAGPTQIAPLAVPNHRSPLAVRSTLLGLASIPVNPLRAEYRVKWSLPGSHSLRPRLVPIQT